MIGNGNRMPVNHRDNHKRNANAATKYPRLSREPTLDFLDGRTKISHSIAEQGVLVTFPCVADSFANACNLHLFARLFRAHSAKSFFCVEARLLCKPFFIATMACKDIVIGREEQMYVAKRHETMARRAQL